MKKTLISFLTYHCQRMQYCFVIEHFEISFLQVKRLGATFDILVDHEYLDAVIRYGNTVVKLWEEGDKESILKALAHELTHVLTGNITDELSQTQKLRKREEQTTEHISRLLFRLYKGKK